MKSIAAKPAEWNTPQKTNMSSENQLLEDVFPILKWFLFGGRIRSFSGMYYGHAKDEYFLLLALLGMVNGHHVMLNCMRQSWKFGLMTKNIPMLSYLIPVFHASYP